MHCFDNCAIFCKQLYVKRRRDSSRWPLTMISGDLGQRSLTGQGRGGGRNAILISQSILFSDLQSIMIDNQIRPWTWATSRYKEFTKDNSFPNTALVLWYIDYLKCIWLLRKKHIRNSKINFTQPIKYQWSSLATSISQLPWKTYDTRQNTIKIILLSFLNNNL